MAAWLMIMPFSIDNLLNVDKLYDDKIIRSNKFKPCDSAVAH